MGQILEVSRRDSSLAQAGQLLHQQQSKIILPMRQRHLENRRSLKRDGDVTAHGVSMHLNPHLRN